MRYTCFSSLSTFSFFSSFSFFRNERRFAQCLIQLVFLNSGWIYYIFFLCLFPAGRISNDTETRLIFFFGPCLSHACYLQQN